MANILLVSEAKSFILTSLVRQLEEQWYTVIQVGNNTNEVQKVKEEIQAVLICGEEGVTIKMEILVYLKDKVIEEDIPVFILGDSEQIAAVESVIPKQFIKKQFLRPINVKETTEEIDEYLKQDASHLKKKYWS